MTEQNSFEFRGSLEHGAPAELQSLIGNPALSELVRSFGFDLPVDSAHLVELQGFMTANWESRNGEERQAVNWDDPTDEASQAASAKVFELTTPLGMVESSVPTKDRYDFLTVLGGANRAPYDRLRYPLELGVNFYKLVLLGSGRLLSAAEKDKAKDYAPGAKTEYDLMNGAVMSLLGDKIVHRDTFDLVMPGVRAEHDPKNWKVRYFELNDATPIFSLSSDFAPETNQEKDARQHKNRPNSGDTYAFMRALAGDMLNPEANVLLVTNAFYAPAQHMDGVRELTITTGAKVETIGYDAPYGGTSRTAKQLKQELKSGIDAAVRLQNALPK